MIQRSIMIEIMTKIKQLYRRKFESDGSFRTPGEFRIGTTSSCLVGLHAFQSTLTQLMFSLSLNDINEIMK